MQARLWHFGGRGELIKCRSSNFNDGVKNLILNRIHFFLIIAEARRREFFDEKIFRRVRRRVWIKIHDHFRAIPANVKSDSIAASIRYLFNIVKRKHNRRSGEKSDDTLKKS